MPKIGNVEWSEKDTKTTLVEKAEQAGVPFDASMTKAELIEMMHTASDVVEEPIKSIPVETTAVPTPPKAEKPTGVLAYLKKAGKRVAFEKLVAELGPNAMVEVKQLLKDGKVTQYKAHNKFYFEAR